jgi:transcriptional regulator with XRE-family HTH domain
LESVASNGRLSRRVDDYVGTRIRLRRTLLGCTQEQLAAALAISYQQIQKYETGTNRVSAGRLFEIANILDTDVAFFFEGLDPGVAKPELPHGGRNRIAIDLVRNFLEIPNEDQRIALANLVKTLKSADADGKQPVSP